MTRALSQDRPQLLDGVQHLVLEDASWELYEKLLHEIGDRPLRVAYDQGRMEIMSPLPEHERPKRAIGRMIEMLAFMLDMPMVCLGSTTFRRRDKAKGLEPDECYYFRSADKIKRRKRIDLGKDPPPELVVEIDITNRSIPREPIYATLKVPEIWRYDGEQLQCLHLSGGSYQVRKKSLAFPFLEPARLGSLLAELPELDDTQMLQRFMQLSRANGWVRESRRHP